MHLHNTYTITDFVIDLSPIQKLLGAVSFLLALTSGTWLAYQAQGSVLVDTPRFGGILTEGIVGTPRFINPILAVSSADRDVVSLVFVGLLRRDARNELVPALAKKYERSEDGLIYTFTLQDNLTFHDGTPLTASDVVFTLTKVADPAIRSPMYANWEGVVVEETDSKTVTITLPEPYAPFIENTTIGILPKHKWQGLAENEFAFSHFNVEPIGAGPYRFSKLIVDKTGIPERYELSAFQDYVLGAPHISSIHFHIFRERADAIRAYQARTVNAVHGLSPTALEEVLKEATVSMDTTVRRVPQQRFFAIFFNQNKQPVLMRKEVREALHEATPKQAVVGEILRGYGTVLEGPLPPHIMQTYFPDTESLRKTESAQEGASEDAGHVGRIERARDLLEDAGWKRHEETGIFSRTVDDAELTLAFSLSTSDIPELVRAAELIAHAWRTLGAEVELKVYTSADLTQLVIRPRKHDALLFGIELGNELDLYAFWHSSQRNDPGVNITQFADIEADAALLSLRNAYTSEERAPHLEKIVERITKERSTVFLYAPDMTYLTRNTIQNVSLHPQALTSERFDTVHEWYMETDRVWPFLPEYIR